MLLTFHSNFSSIEPNTGNLVIDPKQAEVVKRIYREYLEGLSMKKIADGLEQDDILTGADKTKWYDSTINKILRNEKYMGDAPLQKNVTTDFLTKKRVRNTGALPQYYVEDDHEAIIPNEIFMQVQAELVRRRKVHTGSNGQKRIAELQDFIGSQQSEITEFDESLVRNPIQQITVFADHFTVDFKSGITLGIEA